MPIRVRKFVGTIALFVLLIVWTFLSLAFVSIVARWGSPLATAVYYVVAGIGWALPAMPLISWMSRPDRASS
jgi:Protein of unknown function (DUF2842)